MDKRLEALQRDVKFLSLEVDKLMQKRQRQDGYLNDADKEQMKIFRGKMQLDPIMKKIFRLLGQKKMIF